MKIGTKKPVAPVAETRGRKPILGSNPVKINLWLEPELVEEMDSLKELGKEMRLPFVYTRSLLLREGAKLLVKQVKEKLRKAEDGHLHAKPRPHINNAINFAKKSGR